MTAGPSRFHRRQSHYCKAIIQVAEEAVETVRERVEATTTPTPLFIAFHRHLKHPELTHTIFAFLPAIKQPNYFTLIISAIQILINIMLIKQ